MPPARRGAPALGLAARARAGGASVPARHSWHLGPAMHITRHTSLTRMTGSSFVAH